MFPWFHLSGRLATCLIAFGATVLAVGNGIAAEVKLYPEAWKNSGQARPRFEINGTDGRSNPLRQQLAEPFAGDTLFVRYRLRYDAESIDTAQDDDGEFFVLWLDRVEGSDNATHAGGIPNLGIHVSPKGENRFMARFAANAEGFGPLLEGDRDFLVVGRLSKSKPGAKEPFNQLDLWVDPTTEAESKPVASARSPKAISEVRWIGFSTGAKTESTDRIFVWDIETATSWQGILGLAPKPESRVETPPVVARQTVHFKDDIYPILKSHCFKCHEGVDAKKGVRLDVVDEVLSKTSARNAAESRLFELVSKSEMPPEGKGDPLNKEELAKVRAWIDEGLDWDESLLPTPKPKSDHWAFQPIRRPAIPKVRNASWVRTPVDAFIAQRHEQLGLKPAPEARLETLDRRVTLDMLGLPPTVSGTEHAASNISSLLANPAYGESWGRHWLDVARWAESNGHQHNRDRPFAWRYRDYVINAFNDDKPFDQFIREQLAGDELSPSTDETIAATGFLAAARYSGNELDKDIQRNDILVDVVNTTGSAFLGLTLECAQCHTHKFDPISIRDYYRMKAFFAKGQPNNVVLEGESADMEPVIAERARLFDGVHERLVEAKRRQGVAEPILVTPDSVMKGMKPDEKKRFTELDAQIKKLPQAWAFYSPATSSRPRVVTPHDMRWPLPSDPEVLKSMRTFMLIRGDVKSPGPEVEAGWPAVFGPTMSQTNQTRTALADWLTSRNNPLTARVWVNRIWQWHFGTGLVETSGDFGTQGAKPTHPELLDFLASELMDNGWSTKHIHRLILESATYRQSSAFSAANAAIDPDNHALWRWTPRRLEAEAVRDSILAVSGQLDPKRGGPSVSAKSEARRRSLYLKQQRDNLPEQQVLFDSAMGIASCTRRRVSTTALQPLWLMNSDLVQQAAAKLARHAGSVKECVQLVFGREARTDELKPLEQLASEQGLESACLALLNSSEFLYVP